MPMTQVEAVVIEDGRFTFVGDLATARVKPAKITDILHWRATAYPGFIESHGHLSSLGEAITNLDLNGVDSYQTIVGMVADAALSESGQVIKGGDGIRASGQKSRASRLMASQRIDLYRRSVRITLFFGSCQWPHGIG